MSIDLASRTLESALTSAVGVSMAAQKLSKATLSDVQALNKLVEQVKCTAEMGIVIPCGVVNLENPFRCLLRRRWFRKCCLVVGHTHHPELVKTGRFDLSTITS